MFTLIFALAAVAFFAGLVYANLRPSEPAIRSARASADGLAQRGPWSVQA